MLTQEQKKEFRSNFTGMFKVLHSMNVLANPYMKICCNSCGAYQCGDEMDQWSSKGLRKDGYVFTNNQDRETLNGINWIDRGEIYVTYGGHDATDESARLIADRIIAAAALQGLETVWNGDTNTRILVKYKAV